MIVFHNNTGFNVGQYEPGRREAWATAPDDEIEQLARQRGLASRLPSPIENPAGPAARSGDRTSADFFRNFYVVTDIEDFVNLANLGRNVVLQSRRATTGSRACTGDDGSLSIAVRTGRYINLEVAGKSRDAAIVSFNTSMAETALSQMGIAPISSTP
jgi:hypothetical protein